MALDSLRRLLMPMDGRARAWRFRNDPASPWLVSFPRTGSHWLRMMLEAYADRPLLPRSFFAHRDPAYLLVHTHDHEFAARPGRFIYLYRDPVPTIFSQIKFHQPDAMDDAQVELWSTFYRLHLRHWLLGPRGERVVVRYEDLRQDTPAALAPVLDFLGLPIDVAKIHEVAGRISRQAVQEKTQHDPRVVNAEADYQQQREDFAATYGAVIRRLVIDDGNLSEWFPATGAQRQAA